MHRDDGPYLPARLALLPAARHDVTNLTWRPGNFAQSPGNRVPKGTATTRLFPDGGRQHGCFTIDASEQAVLRSRRTRARWETTCTRTGSASVERRQSHGLIVQVGTRARFGRVQKSSADRLKPRSRCGGQKTPEPTPSSLQGWCRARHC
jgi:hypothetical protein